MIRLFIISIIALFAVSVCIAFMPFASLKKQNDVFLPIYIVGGAFWISILLGYGSILSLNHKRKKYLKFLESSGTNRPGILCFWTNMPAQIFDLLTIISLLALIITLIKNQSSTQLIFGLMAIFFFSINMHSLFNGANYKYIKDNKKEIFKGE